jgi:hypothetical protein
VGLICLANWRACSPLSVAPVASGGKLFMTQHAVHEPERDSRMAIASSLDSINSRVPGINSFIWPFHSLLQARTIVPSLSFSFPVALAFSLEKWPVVTIVGSVLVARVQAAAIGHRRFTGL